MRLTNQPEVQSIRQTETIEIRPGVKVTIRAIGSDFIEYAEADIPTPQPPLLNGKRDKTDPEYKKKFARASRLQVVKVVVDGLQDVEFSAERGDDTEAYYAACAAELDRFGFTIGDLNKIAQRVMKLSGVDQEILERAKADFFDQTENADSDTGSVMPAANSGSVT